MGKMNLAVAPGLPLLAAWLDATFVVNTPSFVNRVASPWLDCVERVIETCDDSSWTAMEKKLIDVGIQFIRYTCSAEGMPSKFPL